MKRTYYKIRVDGEREYIDRFPDKAKAMEVAQDFADRSKFSKVEILEYEVELKSAEVVKPTPLYKPLWDEPGEALE